VLAAAVPVLSGALAGAARADVPDAAVRAGRAALERGLGPGGLVTTARGGAGAPVRAVGRLGRGALTGPSPAAPAAVARGYLRRHAAAFGLDARHLGALRATRTTTDPAGARRVDLQQTSDGIPAVDGLVRATVDAGGRLTAVTGPVLPNLDLNTATPAVSAADAYHAVRGGAPAVTRAAGGPERATTFGDGAGASLVSYRDGSTDRLAWRVLGGVDSTHFIDAVVDATTGAVVRVENRVRDVQLRRILRYPGAPVGGTQEDVEIPPGWLTPGATRLTGPNAVSVIDANDAIFVTGDPTRHTFAIHGYPSPGGTGVPPSGGGNWLYPLNLVGGDPARTWSDASANSWQANQNQAATQLFWTVNAMHDHLAAPPIGFDAASGAFEGGDPVIAQALDGAAGPGGRNGAHTPGLPDANHINNANFLTLPDGTPGFMQMYLFGYGAPSAPQVDGADDASIVAHEYAHGLQGRLVTDAQGWDAMSAGDEGGQPGAIGEGTSDWYAMDFVLGQGLATDTAATGELAVGAYASADLRYEALDCPVGRPANCPGSATAGAGGFDYADYGRVYPSAEVHADGEIWAQTLWDLRRALVAAHPDGTVRARAAVTGGLRLSPPFPSFLDMRDAILQSVAALHPDDLDLAWGVFARRGMGWSATTTGALDTRPAAAFDLPPVAATGAAGAVTTGQAVLSALIDPRGTATSYRFQIGPTTAYGTDSAGGSVPPAGVASVSEVVGGLQPATTYHYRVLATRGTRVQIGADGTFTTPPAPPVATPTPTPTPSPKTTPRPVTAKVTTTKATVDRKGAFRLKVAFTRTAATGRAALGVRPARGRSTYAKAKVAVRRGKTVRVKLKLGRAGRRALKPGHTLRVRAVVDPPGSGATTTRTVRLSRKR
jgi:hypothetical protein